LANEIQVTYAVDGVTIYVLIKSLAGLIWDVGDSALEAVGAWNDARADECDVACTGKDAEQYVADFPTACPNGTYLITAYLQGGANPDTDDVRLGSGLITWPTDLRIVLAMHHYMNV
jgi:hypothetical protein